MKTNLINHTNSRWFYYDFDLQLYHDGTNNVIQLGTVKQDQTIDDLYFVVNDGGSTFKVIQIDGSDSRFS